MRIKRTFPPLWFLLVVGLLAQTALSQQLCQQPKVKAVDAIGIAVSEMDRAVDFYSNVLSFKKVSDIVVEGQGYEELLGVPDLRIRVVRMQLGDEFISLIQYIEPSDGKPIPVDSRSNDLWFQHFAIVVSNLDNVSGARVRITALRPSSNIPGIEFLEYVSPENGRPIPSDIKANDIVHWQTILIVDDVEVAEKWLREHNVRFVSDEVSILTGGKLGFKNGIEVLDPDGHAMLIVGK